MNTIQFWIRCGIYMLAFVLSWQALGAIRYEKFIQQGHVKQAQVLYFLLAMALAYLVGSFVNVFFKV